MFTMQILKFVVSLATLIIAAVGGFVGFKSYRRSEAWKKAEFLAREMKAFFDDERVRKTTQMIDWSARRIQLVEPVPGTDNRVTASRTLQARALRPHSVKPEPESTTIQTDEKESDQKDDEFIARFTSEEVAIRDCYDHFLDGLETFASYVETGLIEVQSLKPYIGYWMEKIQRPAAGPKEAAWKATLLTYIKYYGYINVISLFSKFGYDISPSGKTYEDFLKKMDDPVTATDLAKSIKSPFTHNGNVHHGTSSVVSSSNQS
jgi:hypothetical protein